MAKKTCFVVMGYGKKTDYPTGRVLDLDASYRNMIKPAVEEAGLKCIRADEIVHSGTIDVPMYEQLLTADVVVADVSTANPNAFYELGVRHALRPSTTIIIAEDQLGYPFDVNHTVIRRYQHLGADIGVTAATKFKAEIVKSLKEILAQQQDDSPVYTYLKGLRPPLREAEKKAARKRIARALAGEGGARAAKGGGNEALADFFRAQQIRREVIKICHQWMEKEKPRGRRVPRDSEYWVAATLAEAYLGVGDRAQHKKWLKKASAIAPAGWMTDSTREQLEKLETMLAAPPVP